MAGAYEASYRRVLAGLDLDAATIATARTLDRALVSAVAGAELCRQLQMHGVTEFHFYTLNRAELTVAICRLLQAPIPITAFDVPRLGARR